jgi:hypothetical protein
MGVYNDVAPDGAGRGLAMHIGFTWFDPNCNAAQFFVEADARR